MKAKRNNNAAGEKTVLSYATAARTALSWCKASYALAENRLNNIELDGTRVATPL